VRKLSVREKAVVSSTSFLGLTLAARNRGKIIGVHWSEIERGRSDESGPKQTVNTGYESSSRISER
jgi:hypothetical protein